MRAPAAGPAWCPGRPAGSGPAAALRNGAAAGAPGPGAGCGERRQGERAGPGRSAPPRTAQPSRGAASALPAAGTRTGTRTGSAPGLRSPPRLAVRRRAPSGDMASGKAAGERRWELVRW